MKVKEMLDKTKKKDILLFYVCLVSFIGAGGINGL